MDKAMKGEIEMDDRDKYLYHCGGCGKADKDYKDEEILCENTGDYYTPRCSPLEYHKWARSDAYGIYTGLYCGKCYKDKEKYTYRKDRYYDEAYCGEQMDGDY